MPYWLKIFLMGVFVGYMLCMFTGYALIKYDEYKEKKNKGKEEENK